MTTIETRRELYAPQGKVSWIRDKDANIHTYTELGIDAYVGNRLDFANFTPVEDDWNATAAEKRTSHDAELREEDAPFTTAGMDWWGAISPSGFGPTALVDGHGSGETILEASHVITTIPPVDTDVVRDEAGYGGSGGFVSKRRKGEGSGMYRDFLQAASLSTPELDDLFTAEGYEWDNLSEAQMEDKALEMEAWWN